MQCSVGKRPLCSQCVYVCKILYRVQWRSLHFYTNYTGLFFWIFPLTGMFLLCMPIDMSKMKQFTIGVGEKVFGKLTTLVLRLEARHATNISKGMAISSAIDALERELDGEAKDVSRETSR